MILLFSWVFDPIVFCEEGRLTVDYHKAWLIVRVPGCQKLQMTAYLSLVPTHMATVGIKRLKRRLINSSQYIPYIVDGRRVESLTDAYEYH